MEKIKFLELHFCKITKSFSSPYQCCINVVFFIISKTFDVETSALCQKTRILKGHTAMTSNCFQSLLAVHRVDKMTKRNMVKLIFFKGTFFILIRLSLSFITFEQMELESWAWAQKTRLSKLYPDMLASTFDFFVSSLHKGTKVECLIPSIASLGPWNLAIFHQEKAFWGVLEPHHSPKEQSFEHSQRLGLSVNMFLMNIRLRHYGLKWHETDALNSWT